MCQDQANGKMEHGQDVEAPARIPGVTAYRPRALANVLELVGDTSREALGEEDEDNFQLEVALPPEKPDILGSGDEKRMEKLSDPGPGSKKQLKFEELQCDVSVEDDSRQEWTFTLYDFDNNGKVTREGQD
ncbi:protein naked cuticle homolog 1 isoform X2 [Cricetulus griseus]|uniref:Protein naked cuticle homolog n=1 Tax=Cricetulus griseus TaxID=10029 RepID=A0A9J7GSP9_CRIGR|nr:protein naked cuticle homolog 1 isoform X2 [Cricetulus griseus]